MDDAYRKIYGKEKRMWQMMEDAWKNFETSGKIADYLTYRNTLEKTKNRQDAREGATEKGMERYGAEYRFDGDGVKCNANWRI